MGLKFSKPGPGKAVNVVGRHGHFHLLSLITRKFYLHHLVSKKRRRLQVGGYDLDMSYITDRILAMSFPAERTRAMYRNPLWQVKSVLDMRHSGHYKVFSFNVDVHFLLFYVIFLYLLQYLVFHFVLYDSDSLDFQDPSRIHILSIVRH